VLRILKIELTSWLYNWSRSSKAVWRGWATIEVGKSLSRI